MTEFTQLLQQNLVYILSGILILWMFKTRILAKIYQLQSISAQEAYQLLKKKPAEATFLDIRTTWELENESRIKKSKAIPLSQLSGRMEEMKELGLDRKIVVVCRSGSRARSAGVKLRRAGFSEVYVMDGGILSWNAADYPTTRKKKKQNAVLR